MTELAQTSGGSQQVEDAFLVAIFDKRYLSIEDLFYGDHKLQLTTQARNLEFNHDRKLFH